MAQGTEDFFFFFSFVSLQAGHGESIGIGMNEAREHPRRGDWTSIGKSIFVLRINIWSSSRHRE
jgi:hypothetical protein